MWGWTLIQSLTPCVELLKPAEHDCEIEILLHMQSYIYSPWCQPTASRSLPLPVTVQRPAAHWHSDALSRWDGPCAHRFRLVSCSNSTSLMSVGELCTSVSFFSTRTNCQHRDKPSKGSSAHTDNTLRWCALPAWQTWEFVTAAFSRFLR